MPEIRRDGYTPEPLMEQARACAQEPVSPGFKSHLCHLGAAGNCDLTSQSLSFTDCEMGSINNTNFKDCFKD